ncbi:TRAM domain-containing protein [Natronobacterium haloterrestre]|uniref:TRAM domain-containing protein n=1 Tax=Natronobacterium haloterrestre TaxID=148448 RepID=UPI000B7FEB9E|nr:TRAM domain-containing protein [Halobiforma haloterrestris]
MEFSDDLLCLYSAQITERNGSYVVEVPKREVEVGDVQSGEVYRAAIISSESSTQNERNEQNDRPQQPPVEEEDIREVEIEDVGDQGDGIARVERGYVVIVPGTEVGDHVTVRVTETRENVAFAEVIN